MNTLQAFRRGRLGAAAAACGLAVLLGAPGLAGVATAAGDTLTVKVPAAGVSIRYPESWIDLPVTKAAFEKEAKQAVKRNPKLAAVFNDDARARLQKNLQFRAIDADGDFHDNVLVLVNKGTGGPSSLSDFDDAVRAQYGSIGATVLSTKKTTAAKREAYRSDARFMVNTASGARVPAIESVMVFGRGSDLVSIVVAVVDDPAHRALADALLTSVKGL